MNEEKKRPSLFPKILVLHFLLGPLILAIAFYVDGNYMLGHTNFVLFVLFILLYSIWGRRYVQLRPFGIDTDKDKIQDPNKIGRRILHYYFLISFPIGSFFWGLILYWANVMFWGHISMGLTVIWLTIYWLYGVDYFQVRWVQKLKNSKTTQ